MFLPGFLHDPYSDVSFTQKLSSLHCVKPSLPFFTPLYSAIVLILDAETSFTLYFQTGAWHQRQQNQYFNKESGINSSYIDLPDRSIFNLSGTKQLPASEALRHLPLLPPKREQWLVLIAPLHPLLLLDPGKQPGSLVLPQKHLKTH